MEIERAIAGARLRRKLAATGAPGDALVQALLTEVERLRAENTKLRGDVKRKDDTLKALEIVNESAILTTHSLRG